MKNKVAVTVSALAIVGLAGAGTANAASMYMGGVLGVTPAYGTMVGPNGETCKSSAGCKRVYYDNITNESAERGVTKWVAANGKEGNTIWVYSQSTVGAILYLNKNPDDKNTWIFLGSPSVPGNGNEASAPSWFLDNPEADVTFITKQGDSVSQPGTGGNLITHTFGYNNLDMRTPTTSVEIPETNTKSNLYGKPPAVKPRSTFNLFDIRTWFPKKPVTTAVTQKISDETEVATDAVEEAKPTAAEKRAERKAEREAKRAERKAEREAKKEAKVSETKEDSESNETESEVSEQEES